MARQRNSMRQRILQIVFWGATIVWLAVCLYLSWQTGEETAGLSWRIARFLTELLRNVGLEVNLEHFHAGLRLYAHFGIFFVVGILFTGALEVSLPGKRYRNWKVLLLSATVCTFVAVLAEVGKLGVLGRHLQWDEAGLNVLGAICGAAVIWLIFRLYSLWETRQSGSNF